MKHIVKYSLFENVEPYLYEYSGQEGASYIYYFSDGDNNFRVEIDRYPENECEVRYLVEEDGKWTFNEVKTNIWKICETIFGRIIPDFLNKNEWCNTIIIKGLGKSNENSELTQRTKVYWRYLSNNPISEFSIDRYRNEIYIDRN